jgi:hypothetical protein
MGNSLSFQRINFENVQNMNKQNTILINTMLSNEQDCLILNTMNSSQEELMINKMLKNKNNCMNIFIYGKNANDESVYKKYNQLKQLGFYNIYIYSGGLFEWLLLQDIYGNTEFKTTSPQLDILKYKPIKNFDVSGVALIEY